ncbi:hypothetical protein TrVE_jg13944 [Triparma verrucosa]|uniref:Uncharacterized protein n=2 Tax=Triparma TaxID=722752 RepID=A0A9W7DZU1_9STRA|nr:hypothetical protein TrST_g11296 [Triparma strigata]GMI15035.1 hypothetical protein TrVE_jg13944 [Triparma verrucosa]
METEVQMPAKKSLLTFKTVAISVGVLIIAISALIFVSASDDFEKLFKTMTTLELGKPYLASCYTVLILLAGSKVVGKNASKARNAAGVRRMDQYVYEVEGSESGSGAELPKVSLRYSGPDGEFNRAQRAANNWQETRDLELCSLLLLSIAINYFVLLPAGLMFVGRIVFAKGYKTGVSKRLPGFGITQMGNYLSYFLLLMFTIKGSTL